MTHETFKKELFIKMKIDIEPQFYNAVIDRYLDGDFGIDFNKKKFFDLDSEELNLLGTFQSQE